MSILTTVFDIVGWLPGGGVNAKPYVPRSCCVTDDNGYKDLRRCQTDEPPARRPGSQPAGRANPSLHYRVSHHSPYGFSFVGVAVVGLGQWRRALDIGLGLAKCRLVCHYETDWSRIGGCSCAEIFKF